MFNLSENLKALRVSRGFTQEQAAELLGVSKQSVSRWENGVTHPDITLLPVLASFYETTVDELLGSSREKTEKEKELVFQKRHQAHHEGNLREAYDLSQQLYDRFPNDRAVLNCVMRDSYLMGFHDMDGKRQAYLERSVAVSRRFLLLTEDMEERCRAIGNVAVCYKLLGDYEQALAWLNKLPSMWSSIENAALSVYDRETLKDDVPCSLDAVLHLLYRLIHASIDDRPQAEQLAVLQKIPVLFELLFEQGDYGFYNAFLAETYMKIAALSEDAEAKEMLARAQGCAENFAGKPTPGTPPCCSATIRSPLRSGPQHPEKPKENGWLTASTKMTG
ncbi:MAG: helix-turn-helix transcriptional regulator [Clostridia bacterium]|nr:helix-turn-helix transcriptional regulator [Clostridia bacterium]